MHSYISMNNIILVTWIIEGPDNRGPDIRGLTVMQQRREMLYFVPSYLLHCSIHNLK